MRAVSEISQMAGICTSSIVTHDRNKFVPIPPTPIIPSLTTLSSLPFNIEGDAKVFENAFSPIITAPAPAAARFTKSRLFKVIIYCFLN